MDFDQSEVEENNGVVFNTSFVILNLVFVFAFVSELEYIMYSMKNDVLFVQNMQNIHNRFYKHFNNTGENLMKMFIDKSLFKKQCQCSSSWITCWKINTIVYACQSVRLNSALFKGVQHVNFANARPIFKKIHHLPKDRSKLYFWESNLTWNANKLFLLFL